MESPTYQQINPVASKSGVARGMACFRGFVYFLLVVALSLLVALLLLKDNLNDQIRLAVENKLRELFSKTEVRVSLDQAEFKRGRGIRLRGLRMSDGEREIANVNSVFLKTDADIWDLISNRIAAKEIEIDGVKLHVWQSQDDRLNWQRIISKLSFPKKLKKQPIPLVRLRNCAVQFGFREVERPIEISVKQADFQPKEGQDILFANAKLSSDYFKQIDISGEYLTKQRQWRVWGMARRFWLSPEIFEQVPEAMQRDLAAISTLKARVNFDFDVSGNQMLNSIPEFYVVGDVNEGVIKDERLPFPVNHLSANFQADNTGVKFENVVAESLLGKMHLNFSTEGLSPQGPFELVAKVDPLYLDQRLAEKLPPQAREFLQKYNPSGNVRLNSRLSFQDGRWVPDIVVDLLDVSFAFHKFPYPITNSTGRITLDDERVTIDVVAFASGQRVRLNGEFLDPGPDSYGQLKVDMEGAIPIDAKVLAAMEKMPDISNLAKKFHPRGHFGFSGLVLRTRNAQGKIDETFRHRVSVQNSEFKYDLVPIAFEKVSGSIVITETGTSFQGFRGYNVNSQNIAQGAWDPVNGLNLTIDSFDVELNESLRSALPPKAIEFWDQIRPSGALQAVRSNIRARPGKPIHYEISIRQDKENHQLTLNPTWFPYEIKGVDARVSFQPGRFTVERLKGHHRKTRVTASGYGNFDQNGWECHLNQLNFDRLVADREFTSALPKSLGDAVESFEVEGLFNIGGRMSFRGIPVLSQHSRQEIQIQTSWDLTADIDRGSLMCGVPIEDIYGAVRLTGFSQGSQFESLGGMEIDSLVWNDVQFKKVRSPIYLDNKEALLGLWATAKRKDVTPQPLSGILFGGKLAGNARFSLHGNQPFQIHATLNEGDLQEFTFELAPSYEKVVGKGFAGIQINGDKSGTHALRGKGEVRLVDAKISEVPIMLSMLKLLSVSQVDRTLFNESNIDFTVKGEHLFFDNLEFLGDAISIKGNGEMDFDQNIDLQFYTAVGRDGFRIPVISPLLGVASQQILVIDVKGKTDDPKVKKNFFKLFNGKLKENLEDLEDSIDEGSEFLLQAAERPFGSNVR